MSYVQKASGEVKGTDLKFEPLEQHKSIRFGKGRPDLGGKAKEWAQDLYDTVFNKVSQLSDDVLYSLNKLPELYPRRSRRTSKRLWP